ncbi:MAG: tyrosine-type recombinase/integrase [Rhodospirillaceae bacterium]
MGGRESSTRKFKIGTHGTITPDQARTQAEQVLANIRLGVDPGAEKAAAREPKIGKTAAEAVELVLVRHVSQLRTADRSRKMFDSDVLPKWGKRETVSIRRADAIELLDQIADSGRPVQANRTFSLVWKFFNWCVERGIVESTPCSGVKAPTAEVSRDRVLDDDELRRLWIAVSGMPYPFDPWVRLLILTGQRRDEVAGMRWSELDVDAGMWSIPKEQTKNRHAHDVPLPAAALGILAALPRDGDDFASTTKGEDRHIGLLEGQGCARQGCSRDAPEVSDEARRKP